MARTHLNFQDLMQRGQRLDSGCIIWTGQHNAKGYGCVRIVKMTTVHRVVAKLFYGSPESNQVAMHSCDNRACFNPNHLSWGSHRDNVLDMHKKNRQYKVPLGANHPNSIFTWGEVYEIRAMHKNGMMIKDIAKLKNCNPSTIGLIVNNKTWKRENHG